jgi:cytochrome c oxidase subunit II
VARERLTRAAAAERVHGHRPARTAVTLAHSARRNFLVLVVLAVGAALALAAVASAGNGGFAPETPRSPNAARIDDSYVLIGAIALGIFALVETSLLWFVFRYRRRNRPRDAEGPQIHGATRLELIWTAIPVLILVAIVSFVFYKLPGIKDVPSAKAQGGPLVVRVDAHQFYWQFTYPNGATSIEELHVPVNRVVRVDIHSQDVDHSWWIPQLQGKFDAIPGQTTHTWFRAERPGTYRGQCGEFCGVYHSAMVARVVAKSQSDYESYLASVRKPIILGGQEWRGVCAQCHGMNGAGGYGPNIKSNSTLIQTSALRRLLREGQNQLKPVENYMPPVGRGWTDAQLTALQAYIKARVYKEATTSGG